MNYLTGWKDIAKFLGFHVRTVRRWHYERKRLPYEKTGPGMTNRIRIKADEALQWAKSLRDIPNNRTSDK